MDENDDDDSPTARPPIAGPIDHAPVVYALHLARRLIALIETDATPATIDAELAKLAEVRRELRRNFRLGDAEAITDDMVRAGAERLADTYDIAPMAYVVREIYTAMVQAGRRMG